MIKFISLSSGSSGNCYYFGNEQISFIIDAGIGVRTIRKRLSNFGVDLADIHFILVTHDHTDHIKHLVTLSQRIERPVLATERLFQSLKENRFTKGGVIRLKKVIYRDEPFIYRGVSITPFELPHDATENLGYYIDFNGERFTLITDLGHVTDRVIDFCKRSNHIIIESNYDEMMLKKGSYPPHLIERVSGERGHLSNDQSAEALMRMWHNGIRNIFLCHLSENNNNPQLAYQTAREALEELGVDVDRELHLSTLPRREAIAHTIKVVGH